MKASIISKTVFVIFFSVIAIPGWAIEGLVRRFRPDWEFTAYTATPYFAFFSILSTYLICYQSTFWIYVGIYILTTMQMLGQTLSIAVAFGKEGRLLNFLRSHSGRLKKDKMKTTFTRINIYIAAITFLFTIYYFGALNYFVYSIDSTSFTGILDGNIPKQFFDFIYYSAGIIFTLGSEIQPQSTLTKLLNIIEILIGLVFLISLFGGYISYRTNELSEEK